MESDKIRNALHNDVDVDAYNGQGSFKQHLLEQYKIFVAATEAISSRRQTANSFFVTINTVLISFTSYFNFSEHMEHNALLVVSLAGLAISFMWYRLIRSYKGLNTAKFKVIREIENHLPLKPYDAEWEAVDRGNDPALYLPFTSVEVFVPLVFMFLHMFIFVIISFVPLKNTFL